MNYRVSPNTSLITETMLVGSSVIALMLLPRYACVNHDLLQ